MSEQNESLIMQSWRDIFRFHGLLVLILYYSTKVLQWASLSFWIRSLPRFVGKPDSAIDRKADKISAWWQDAVSLVFIAFTPAALLLALSPRSCLTCLGLALSGYLIFDAAIYYVRVLWFDDIQPSIVPTRRKVWSHRRILFLAIAAYAQSILLFGVLYSLVPALQGSDYLHLLEESFLTATLLGVNSPLSWVNVLQVGFSFFYLAIVIAITASISYRREEYAGKS